MFITVTCECGQAFEAPEADVGRLAQCPACGLLVMVPGLKSAPAPEVVFLSGNPTATSGKAVASLAMGVLFFFACLSGIPAILLGRQALIDINRSGGQLRGKKRAVIGIVLGVMGCLFTVGFFLPAYRSAREGARRSQCVSNLKWIGLAMTNYYSTHDCLPPAAITDKNGKPLLSWRVAMLPFTDPGGSLYAKFHLDEPWDSPHNLALVNQMPLVYACPSDYDRKPGTTGYQVVIGPDTAFTPDYQPLPLEKITHGLSESVLVGECRHNVPWTKPEDLPLDLTIPLSGLGSHHGYHNNGFNAVFADDSVRFLKSTINQRTLTHILSRTDSGVAPADSY